MGKHEPDPEAGPLLPATPLPVDAPVPVVRTPTMVEMPVVKRSSMGEDIRISVFFLIIILVAILTVVTKVEPGGGW